MTYLVVFCLAFLLICIKCDENKEFCDKSFREDLMTGVMSYKDLYFLVFREYDVWSLEYNTTSEEF